VATTGPTRLQSLDVFRGVTIAAMMLVNKQGEADAGYAALQHVPWHGATPTDWIFPFFLFIMGVALPFSIASRRRQGATNAELLRHACSRALILFALGVFEKNFPFLSATLETFRIPGVLQRIAFCYLAGTALLLYTSRRAQAIVATVLLLGYWGLLAFVPVPGAGVVPMTREFASANWAAWIDQLTMGRHLGYGNHTWDANGLLSSLPSIVTMQMGVLAAFVLQAGAASMQAVTRLALLGSTGLVIGWLWGGVPPLIGLGIIGEPQGTSALVFPINKMLWTSSYVLFTGGLALIALAASVWGMDVRRREGTEPGWAATPFIWLGSNAIFAYLASGLVAKLLHVFTVSDAAGTRLSWWDWAQRHVFAAVIPDAAFASLVHSAAYALIWVAICGWMYRRRVFLKL
jgi:predicted acyltransferase